MRIVLGLAAAAALFAGGAPAAEPGKLSLTVYNSDLALVQDIRNLSIAAGRQRLEFKDVSARIRPETVSLVAADVGIVEQNFDYDLLTPEKLMEKAVGRQVQIVRINPGNGAQVTETATVLSVNGGVVLKIGDRIEVLRQDDVPTRVIFDGIPQNLRAKPTLSVTVDSGKAGARPATLSYLTNGLSWKADYVAMFDEGPGKLDLQGWVTLTNTSGVDYPDAAVQLVAGDVNLANNEQEYWQRRQMARNTSVRRGGVGGPVETGPTSVADYYLYPLPGHTTVAQNQTKQVSFLDAKGAAARKAYEYRAYWFETLQTPANADVAVQFSNASHAGLGRQLPAGIVRVYVRDQAGEPKFVGENRIDHTPQGSDISVKIGEAFDVTVQPTVVAQDGAGKTRSRYRMSCLVRNAKAQPVTVVIRQGGLWREGKVIDESLKSRRLDAYNLAWDVPVPANGETTLTFTVETGW
ncbi:MAG: hypothetical protein JWP28_2037 [Phenylobacterium sp.]|uniref:DUF4139 domain-containing protein n=1 Tax=Phenylobacterium sp. TaxID=1871053 RepID=UPI0026163AD6|nr:DUF4139 domain-containing protein [Phenylobacterium sp.]MDB5498006.1 hypothetical protein [Phenylobacterium sp.]